MFGSTARMANTWAMTLTSHTRCHASVGASTPWFVPMPALQTSRSIGPEPRLGGLHGGYDIGLHPHVRLQAEPHPAKGRGHGLRRGELEVHHRDARRAFCCEPLAQRAADAIGTAGDEGDLAGQLHALSPSRCRLGSPARPSPAGRHPTGAA